ncbi:hypothetical protein MLD38_033153 [Melastoma candidum]|uniref:Uncharacterized protein n=1 Tax=Melastoma candidum TaxID=119954 RepID=A0ACB9M694_9MYRT|nr:hypothetical protein MLD38_033153 [Melastoma candidum]
MFPLQGNAYPAEHYRLTIPVGTGQSRRNFEFDPDTGSDVTWLPCRLPGHPVPPTVPGQPIYEARRDQIVPNNDEFCKSLGGRVNKKCGYPGECCYTLEYGDDSKSEGVLIRETLTFGDVVAEFVIGCGYRQTSDEHLALLNLISLGPGMLGIPSQLHRHGIQNVVGHCLNGTVDDRSFIFIGRYQELRNLPALKWTDMSTRKGLYSHQAQLNYGGKRLHRSVDVYFDTGSTHSYFIPRVFNQVIGEVEKGLRKDFIKTSESHCWRSRKPVPDVLKLATNNLNAFNFYFGDKLYSVEPKHYIYAKDGRKICLGISETDSRSRDNLNGIGDISMQGKLLIFDNEVNKIGWGEGSCNAFVPRPS